MRRFEMSEPVLPTTAGNRAGGSVMAMGRLMVDCPPKIGIVPGTLSDRLTVLPLMVTGSVTVVGSRFTLPGVPVTLTFRLTTLPSTFTGTLTVVGPLIRGTLMVALVERLIVCACANEQAVAHTQTYEASAPRMEIGLKRLLAQRVFPRLVVDH